MQLLSALETSRTIDERQMRMKSRYGAGSTGATASRIRADAARIAPTADPLTDDHAPVDNLLAPVFATRNDKED